VAGEHLLERVNVEAVGVAADADHARARRSEAREPAREGRCLDDGDVAGLEQRARDQVDRLLRAARDDELVSVGAPAFRAAADRELLAQLVQALRRQVAEHVAADVVDHPARDVGELLHRVDLRRREAR
jgi:hypothetical protein